MIWNHNISYNFKKYRFYCIGSNVVPTVPHIGLLVFKKPAISAGQNISQTVWYHHKEWIWLNTQRKMLTVHDCAMLCTSADPITYQPINILQVNRQWTKRCKRDQKRKLGMRAVLKKRMEWPSSAYLFLLSHGIEYNMEEVTISFCPFLINATSGWLRLCQP